MNCPPDGWLPPVDGGDGFDDDPDELSPDEERVLMLHESVLDALADRDSTGAGELTASLVRAVRTAADPDDIAEQLGFYMMGVYAEGAGGEDPDPSMLYAYLDFGCTVGDALRSPVYGAFFVERASHALAVDVRHRLDDARRAAALLPVDERDGLARVALVEGACLLDLGRLDDAIAALGRVDLADPDIDSVVVEGVAAVLASILVSEAKYADAAQVARAGLAAVDADRRVPSQELSLSILASHVGLVEIYATEPPTLLEFRTTAELVHRFNSSAGDLGLEPASVDLVNAIASLGAGDLDEAEAYLDLAEAGMNALDGPRRARGAVTRAQLDLARGDLRSLVPHLAVAGRLVAEHGDARLRAEYASLLEVQAGFGNSDGVGSAQQALDGMPGVAGRLHAAAIDARRRILSGIPQPTLTDELLFLADGLDPAAEPQAYCTLLYLAAVAVAAKSPPGSDPSLFLERVQENDSILERLERSVIDLRLRAKSPFLAEPHRVFAAAGRCFNAAVFGDGLQALRRLQSLRDECLASGASTLALAVTTTAQDLASLLGDHETSLRMAAAVLDGFERYAGVLSSAADRARHDALVSKIIRDAFASAEAIRDYRAIAELIEVVRAQSIPVVPLAPPTDQTPLSALMEAVDAVSEPMAGWVSESSDASAATLGQGGADQTRDEIDPVTLIGVPPRIRMPWGSIALEVYGAPFNPGVRVAQLIVPR